MKWIVVLAMVFCGLFSGEAEARRHRHPPTQVASACIFFCNDIYSVNQNEGRRTNGRIIHRQRVGYSDGLGPRPGRWCGWWMRKFKGITDPSLNLARNWARVGSPAGGPQVGAVVVWRSHVGIITGRTDSGQWIVKSGNDGGRVRERARSVAGAIAFRLV